MTDQSGRLRFEAARDRGRDYFRALYNYLLHYARDAYEDFAGEEHSAFDAVSVLTIHQAKGLEWPVVFLPALVEGRFPSRLAGTPQTWLLPEDVFPPSTRARYEGGDTEERRLFYVALTRARECVYLSAFQRKTNQFRPSPYLLEVAGSWPPDDAPPPLPAAPPPRQADDTSPVDVSYSDLATFEDCGYRYRLANVFGFQRRLLRNSATVARSTMCCGRWPSTSWPVVARRTRVCSTGYWPIRCSSPSPLRRRGRRCGVRRGDWWCGIWPSTRTS